MIDGEPAHTTTPSRASAAEYGEQRLLEDLHRQFAPSLYRYAWHLLGSAEDAQDAVGEVFARLARRGVEISLVVDVRAYLYTATRNVARRAIRRDRRRREGELAGVEERAIPPPGGHELIAVRQALSHLPPEQREVILLRAFEGMTLNEIAGITGASVSTVAGRYRYAVDKLRRALGDGEDG